jgi:hypothetical protein
MEVELGLENNPNFFFNSYLYIINVNFRIMPKYKISKSNLKEFFGLFGDKKKPKDLQTIIDNDPVLKKLDADIAKLNNRSGQLPPETVAILKKYGAY